MGACYPGARRVQIDPLLARADRTITLCEAKSSDGEVDVTGPIFGQRSAPTLLQLLWLLVAGWVNRHQLEVIEYLQEENRLLRGRLSDRCIRFSDCERRRLARKAH